MTLDSKVVSANLTSTMPRLATSPAYHRRIYLWALLVSDTLMLALSFALAYWLRFNVGVALSSEVVPVPEKYLRLVIILIPFWLSLFALMRMYDFRILLGGTSEYARAFNACTSGMMLVVVVSFVDDSFVIARGWLVMSWLLAAVLVAGGRLLLRRVAYQLRRAGYFVEPAIVIGTNSEAVALAAQLHSSRHSGLAILGFVETQAYKNDGSVDAPHPQPVLGTIDELSEIVSNRNVHEVIVATTALSRDHLLRVFQSLMSMPDVKMRLSSGLYEVFTTNVKVDLAGSVPLMSLDRLRLDPIEATLKRMLDCTLILLASVALVPLLALLGLLVKLDSRGPIFYRRRVLGVGGKEFDAFKFRTMYVDGDEILARDPALLAEFQKNHKLKDDPRVTRVGRILRALSLDELPQLLNVFLGQMSLVGPRMISPEEAEKYGVLTSNLLTVKPGITGLWQVSGRSELSYEERVRLDMHYIRNYSIWMDLQILFIQTLPAVLKREGAY